MVKNKGRWTGNFPGLAGPSSTLQSLAHISLGLARKYGGISGRMPNPPLGNCGG